MAESRLQPRVNGHCHRDPPTHTRPPTPHPPPRCSACNDAEGVAAGHRPAGLRQTGRPARSREGGARCSHGARPPSAQHWHSHLRWSQRRAGQRCWRCACCAGLARSARSRRTRRLPGRHCNRAVPAAAGSAAAGPPLIAGRGPAGRAASPPAGNFAATVVGHRAPHDNKLNNYRYTEYGFCSAENRRKFSN